MSPHDLDRGPGSRVGRRVRQLGAIGLSLALAVGLAVAGCGGGGKKGKTTPGKGSGSGDGSDAVGMNDGTDPGGGDGLPGTGSGDIADELPGGGGGDGGSGDGGGSGSGSGSAGEPTPPPIVVPNLDISPEQARAEVTRHLNTARGMLAGGDPDGAIREAKAALAADGTSIDAQIVIAHAYYLKKLNDTAEVVLDGLYNKRKTSQQNPYLYYVYGLVYDRAGDRTKAFAAYKQAVSLDPRYASALVNLGVHQLANKQYVDATTTYETLTGTLGRADASTLSALGAAYRGRSADYDVGSANRDDFLRKAENAFKRATTADRNYGPAYYNLGLLYLDADPFPGPDGPLDTLVRLNRAKTYFDEYKNMPGVDLKLYDERTKDVTKLIKREEKKRKKSGGASPASTLLPGGDE